MPAPQRDTRQKESITNLPETWIRKPQVSLTHHHGRVFNCVKKKRSCCATAAATLPHWGCISADMLSPSDLLLPEGCSVGCERERDFTSFFVHCGAPTRSMSVVGGR